MGAHRGRGVDGCQDSWKEVMGGRCLNHQGCIHKDQSERDCLRYRCLARASWGKEDRFGLVDGQEGEHKAALTSGRYY